ncbi:MAG: hypothetical protein ACYDEV_05505 [Acidiferrobacter sp.]
MHALMTEIGWPVLCAGFLLLNGCSPPPLLQTEQKAAHAYQHDQLIAAARIYQRLVAVAPHNPLLWARLGNCEAVLGHVGAAAHAYEQALALRPSLTIARYNLARVRLQQARSTLILAETTSHKNPVLNGRVHTLLTDIDTLLAHRGRPLPKDRCLRDSSPCRQPSHLRPEDLHDKKYVR